MVHGPLAKVSLPIPGLVELDHLRIKKNRYKSKKNPVSGLVELNHLLHPNAGPALLPREVKPRLPGDGTHYQIFFPPPSFPIIKQVEPYLPGGGSHGGKGHWEGVATHLGENVSELFSSI